METKQNIPRNPRRRTPFQRNRRLQAEMLAILLIAVVVAFVALALYVPHWKSKHAAKNLQKGGKRHA